MRECRARRANADGCQFGAGGAIIDAMRIAVLTISDAGVRGERADTSGEAIIAWATGRGDVVTARALVGDETGEIAARLREWCDGDAADLVLTTGGTGLSARDVTPEATLAVIEREAPGISERIRTLSLQSFPRAALSRGVTGVRALTLIVNLPGSPAGVRDALAALEPIVNHGVDILRGAATNHDGHVAAVERRKETGERRQPQGARSGPGRGGRARPKGLRG
jgi:molybdopterin adenylyltransferase